MEAPSRMASSLSAPPLKPFGALEEYSANAPWAIFPRKKLDVTYADIAAALHASLSLQESQRSEYEQKIARRWDATGHAMATLSVRTGFDLFLQTLKLPAGSQVLCSAVTIPDMLYLLRFHQLVPVPIDLDPETLEVDADQLRAAVTEKTRAIMVAHIFGSRHALAPVIAVAREFALVVIEDCAQAFAGLEYTGDREADVSMFSFGTIKTGTAFGGAVLRVKDLEVLAEMKRRESRYSARTTAFFVKRLIKYGALHGLSTPALYGLLLNTCKTLGVDHEKLITSSIRGFSGGELVSLLRHRPSMPLLSLLYRRIANADPAYVLLRKAKSEQLVRAIQDIPNIEIPGVHARTHYYWLFPIVVPSPDRVMRYMNQHGFDVTAGATQLAFVPSPEGTTHDPVHAKRIMENLVYLPVTAETPDWAIDKMARCLRESLKTSRL